MTDASHGGGAAGRSVRFVAVFVVFAVAPAGSVSDFLISVRPLLRSRPSVRPSCDFHHSGGFLFIVSEGGGRARAPSIYLPPEQNVFATSVAAAVRRGRQVSIFVPLSPGGGGRATDRASLPPSH